MNLTTEQIAAIKGGTPVRIANSEIGMECIVLRADVYENAKSQVDEDFEPRQMYPAVLKALDSCDESPEQYLEYLDE